ncbi:hypothetical protein [Aureivirga sp. CE67]|uniref:hypothetical protein n=1 Tax=Aureivirga sp. CE67 TaxID=1788983 RepID=UPI0018CAEB82|nr:hypothetical protein [Aureivirga sp. CE67]
MKKIILPLLVLSLFACNRVKDKATSAINKTGEIIGESSSELVNGISNGIDKKYKCTFEIPENEKFKGLETGIYEIKSNNSGRENVISLYVIFNEDFKQNILIKAFNEENLEYGRKQIDLSGKKGEAKYVDISFNDEVKIKTISNFTFE